MTSATWPPAGSEQGDHFFADDQDADTTPMGPGWDDTAADGPDGSGADELSADWAGPAPDDTAAEPGPGVLAGAGAGGERSGEAGQYGRPGVAGTWAAAGSAGSAGLGSAESSPDVPAGVGWADEPGPVGGAAGPRGEAAAVAARLVDNAGEGGPEAVQRVGAAVGALDEMVGRSVGEHVRWYDALHGELSDALASIDEV